MQQKKNKPTYCVQITSLLLVYSISAYCYASDVNPPPMELVGSWRITEIQADQTYTELSDCGLGKMLIQPDRANEFNAEFGFLFDAYIPNNSKYQCFTSPEPGVLAPPKNASLFCAVVPGGGNLLMSHDEVKWRCKHDNLNDSECDAFKSQLRNTNHCIAERRSFANQHPIAMPTPLTGYEFDEDRLVLHGSSGEKVFLQRHRWFPGLEEEPAYSEPEPNQ